MGLLKEKDMLLQEMYHRIKNNMATEMVSLFPLGNQVTVVQHIITFSTILDGNQASLVLEDNGIGMLQNFDLKLSTGFGMKLVQMFGSNRRRIHFGCQCRQQVDLALFGANR